MEKERLAEIRAALEAATIRPWRVRERTVGHPGRIYQRDIYASINDGRGSKPIASVYEGYVQTDANARLIANAPTYLDELLQEVETLEHKLAQERNLSTEMLADYGFAIDNITTETMARRRLDEENKRLRGAILAMLIDHEKYQSMPHLWESAMRKRLHQLALEVANVGQH